MSAQVCQHVDHGANGFAQQWAVDVTYEAQLSSSAKFQMAVAVLLLTEKPDRKAAVLQREHPVGIDIMVIRLLCSYWLLLS
jgi:hypothetical protein